MTDAPPPKDSKQDAFDASKVKPHPTKAETAAMEAVHAQLYGQDGQPGDNHYRRGQGPYSGLTNLYQKNELPHEFGQFHLKMDGTKAGLEDDRKTIQKIASGMSQDRAHEQAQHHGHKKGKHHDTPVFTSKDNILSPEMEQALLLEKAEKGERQAKHDMASKLAPTVDQINAALMNPELAAKLTQNGIKPDAAAIRNGIIQSMDDDPGLNSDRIADRIAKKQGAPVGAPYVAMGVIDEKGVQDILKDQSGQRKAYLNEHYPDHADLSKKENRDWLDQQLGKDSTNTDLKDLYKNTDFGSLLRQKAAGNTAQLAKIDAADELIKSLQRTN